jgi:hypothetical protein
VRLAEDLIDGIVNSSRVPPGKRRREIQRELRAHIEDFVVAAREAGRNENEIEQLVVANFGDPSQIARGFAWVYRHERRRLRVLAYILSTLLLASSLLATILATQAGLAFGVGTPIMNMLVSRHTLIEGLDIVASVAVYLGLISLEDLFERRRFQKAAVLLAAIVSILIVSCAATGLHANFLIFGLVNGLFFRAVQLLAAPKAARVGIVMVCFPVAGLVLAVLRSPVSQVALEITCVSWLVMGVGYQLMTDIAARVDAALLNGLQGFKPVTERR